MAQPIMVAAIDFGTTFSGYAFSLRHDFEQDPLRIHASSWTTGSRMSISLKTSSTVLFSPDRKFHSFGFEAEDRYSDLALDDEHRDWYYFRRFKMMLYASKDIHRDTRIKDEMGKEMLAMDVFSAAIQYLKDHLGKACDDRMFGVTDAEIKWVLTVPAIWDDAAKQFMREAAINAGIMSERLVLALEPEAASMFCKHLPVERIVGDKDKAITCFKERSRYLVLDAGGGTIDITVHEVQKGGKLKELHKATGGAWGGTTIDKAFLDFLESITGPEVMEMFRTEQQDDYIELLREFEVKKRTIEPKLESKMTFKIPISLHELYRDVTGNELRDAVRKSPEFDGKVTFAGDKMRMDAEAVKNLFKETNESIIIHLQQIFSSPIATCTDSILMVGGFSESPMLQHAVKDNFPEKRVITPHEAGLAVLKGAVIFGHDNKEIVARVARYTYGLKSWLAFDPSRHPESKKQKKNGQYEVRGAFNKLVEIGQEVLPDVPSQKKTFFPVEGTDAFCIKLYLSPKKDPIFVDEEDAKLLGKLEVDCKGKDGCIYGADVSLIFGGTELEVKAVHAKTGKETTASFNFL